MSPEQTRQVCLQLTDSKVYFAHRFQGAQTFSKKCHSIVEALTCIYMDSLDHSKWLCIVHWTMQSAMMIFIYSV